MVLEKRQIFGKVFIFNLKHSATYSRIFSFIISLFTPYFCGSKFIPHKIFSAFYGLGLIALRCFNFVFSPQRAPGNKSYFAQPSVSAIEFNFGNQVFRPLVLFTKLCSLSRPVVVNSLQNMLGLYF